MIFASPKASMRNIVRVHKPRCRVARCDLGGVWPVGAVSRAERAFYRYALSQLRAAFPALPDREQFNRVPRQSREVIVAFCLYVVVERMQGQRCLDETLDSSGIPTRDAKR